MIIARAANWWSGLKAYRVAVVEQEHIEEGAVLRGYPLHGNNVAGKKDIAAEGPTGGQKTGRRREGINNTLVPSK